MPLNTIVNILEMLFTKYFSSCVCLVKRGSCRFPLYIFFKIKLYNPQVNLDNSYHFVYLQLQCYWAVSGLLYSSNCNTAGLLMQNFTALKFMILPVCSFGIFWSWFSPCYIKLRADKTLLTYLLLIYLWWGKSHQHNTCAPNQPKQNTW